MRSSVETLEDNRVKLTVELDEAEFEPEVDAAFERIAREVRVPGFRPGRVPPRLLEAQLGRQAGRSEALRASLPDYYVRAVVEHDVDVIASPAIEIIEGSESGPVCFDAVVEVRPTVLISGHDSLRVQIPSPTVDEGEITEELDRFRQQFADLVTVKRPAVDGDHLTIDITGTLGGETIDGLTTSDYDYRVGTGAVVAEIDENLRGASAGDILDFDAVHPDPEEDRRLNFRVLVKEVRETVLPELDDEFVSANSEHGTVAEFRDALEAAHSRVRVMNALQARHEAVIDAVAALIVEDVPEAMVESDLEALLANLRNDLDRRGFEMDAYLAATGQSYDDLVDGLRGAADRSVKLDLALRAMAAAEGLEADDAAVEAELGRAALASTAGPDDEAAAEEEAARMREALASSGRLSALRSEISKRAAMEWVIERVELVDPDGAVVDPDLLALADEEDGASADPDTRQDASAADDPPGDDS